MGGAEPSSGTTLTKWDTDRTETQMHGIFTCTSAVFRSHCKSTTLTPIGSWNYRFPARELHILHFLESLAHSCAKYPLGRGPPHCARPRALAPGRRIPPVSLNARGPWSRRNSLAREVEGAARVSQLVFRRNHWRRFQ